MHPLAQVQVRRQLIGLIVVDGQRLLRQFLLDLQLGLNDGLVEGAVGDAFGEDGLIEVELLLDVLVLIGLLQSRQEVALHQCLILAGDLLGSNAIDAVSIVSDSDEERSQEDGHVEAVALLPPRDIGGTGDALGELIGWVELLVLDELAEPLGALLVVVKLQKSEFGGPDGGADELVDLALVLGEEEELPILADVLLELLLELDDMLQHKFLLGRVLTV